MKRIIFGILIFIRRKIQLCMGVTTVGVKALVVNDRQEILLVEHTYTKGWHFPGGGVKTGETPIQAVIRELREETGVIAKADPQLFGVYFHQIYGASDMPILYVIKQFEMGEKIACPNCGSLKMQKAKDRPSRTGFKRQFQCQDCGSYHTSPLKEGSQIR